MKSIVLPDDDLKLLEKLDLLKMANTAGKRLSQAC
jgi:hypothetical protein